MTTSEFEPPVDEMDLPPEQTLNDWWKENAQHSAIGLLMESADKTLKKNGAMPTGTFWSTVLRPLLREMHRFHLDAIDDLAEGDDDVDPEYVQHVIDLCVDAKNLLETETKLLMGAFQGLGYLDETGAILIDKMPDSLKGAFADWQIKMADWASRYPALIDETEGAA